MTDRLRFLLGSILIIGVMALGAAIALGHVEEKTSFGLTGIMTMLGKVVLDFSEWSFRSRRDEVKPEPPKDKDVAGREP